jgi:hypothetical protein
MHEESPPEKIEPYHEQHYCKKGIMRYFAQGDKRGDFEQFIAGNAARVGTPPTVYTRAL